MSGANISAEQESYNAIRTAVRNLQTHLQTLNAKVKAEVQTAIGGWQGGASQAFNSVMDQWDAGSAKATQARLTLIVRLPPSVARSLRTKWRHRLLLTAPVPPC